MSRQWRNAFPSSGVKRSRSGSYPLGEGPLALHIENALGDATIVVDPRADGIQWMVEGKAEAVDRTDVSCVDGVLQVIHGGRRSLFGERMTASIVRNDDVDVYLTVRRRPANAYVNLALGDLEVRGAEFGPATVRIGKGDAEFEALGPGPAALADADPHTPGAPAGAEAATESVVDVKMGDIEVGTGGRLRLSTKAGDVDVHDMTGDVTVKVGAGDTAVGSIRRGDLVAESGLGDIHVGVPRGTAVLLDCHSSVGDVDSRLTAGEPDPQAPRVSIAAKTRLGDVKIGYA